MTSPSLVLVVAVARAWTRVYTWRLDPLLRERRHAEIESDLWEFQQDAGDRGLNPAVQVLARLAIGMPDDLAWRADHVVVEVTAERRVAAVAATAAAFFVAAFWIFAATRPVELPKPPGAPIRLWNLVALNAPPPPPPPPPCQPPTLMVGCR